MSASTRDRNFKTQGEDSKYCASDRGSYVRQGQNSSCL